jgi:metallo-beta-lactamase class B
MKNFIFFFFLNILDCSAQQPLIIKKLTHSIYVYKTYNYYNGEKFEANGLYCITPRGVIMVDTPWDTTQFQPLLDSIAKKHGKSVLACISTHWHADRTAGLTYYRKLGIKTFTTAKTDSISAAQQKPRAEYILHKDTALSIGGIKMEIFYPGEGHTVDNIVIWFPQNRVLYGGCLIKSTEATDIGFVGDGNIKAYPETLKRVQQKFPNPRYIIPGHQGWANNKSIVHTLYLLKTK